MGAKMGAMGAMGAKMGAKMEGLNLMEGEAEALNYHYRMTNR